MPHHHESQQKGSSKANSSVKGLTSRPFATQATPDVAERSPEPPSLETQSLETQSLETPSTSFSILEPGGGQATPIQPKLTIGAPDDKYEQEADSVAEQVVQRLSTPDEPRSPVSQVQRQSIDDDEALQMSSDIAQPTLSFKINDSLPRQVPLQLKVDVGASTATPDLERSIQQKRGQGQPLADAVRQPLEQAFGGVDFGGVNIHTDAQSDELNQSIQAKAFTTGQDIFFRQGTYQPNSQSGQKLLAHELTHVVQQNGQNLQKTTDPQLTDSQQKSAELTVKEKAEQTQRISRAIEVETTGYEIAVVMEELKKRYGYDSKVIPNLQNTVTSLDNIKYASWDAFKTAIDNILTPLSNTEGEIRWNNGNFVCAVSKAASDRRKTGLYLANGDLQHDGIQGDKLLGQVRFAEFNLSKYPHIELGQLGKYDREVRDTADHNPAVRDYIVASGVQTSFYFAQGEDSPLPELGASISSGGRLLTLCFGGAQKYATKAISNEKARGIMNEEEPQHVTSHDPNMIRHQCVHRHYVYEDAGQLKQDLEAFITMIENDPEMIGKKRTATWTSNKWQEAQQVGAKARQALGLSARDYAATMPEKVKADLAPKQQKAKPKAKPKAKNSSNADTDTDTSTDVSTDLSE